MSDFQKLLAEINDLSAEQEAMTKALPADDGKDEDKIQAAAAEGGLGDEDEGEGDGEGEGGGELVAKSFKLTLEDGTEIEAQDGTEMVKSLRERIDTTEETMAKALAATLDLVKGQGALLKSMSDRITKLSGEGRGRKTVLSVVEKPAPGAGTLAKSEPAGISTNEFFAKAMVAQKAGHISGMDIATAEAHLNRGEPIPASIIQRVAQ